MRVMIYSLSDRKMIVKNVRVTATSVFERKEVLMGIWFWGGNWRGKKGLQEPQGLACWLLLKLQAL